MTSVLLIVVKYLEGIWPEFRCLVFTVLTVFLRLDIFEKISVSGNGVQNRVSSWPLFQNGDH